MTRTTVRRSAGALLLAAWLPGCVSWRTVPVEPGRYVAEQRPEKVRLVTSDSQVVELRYPRILRDSFIGDQPVGNTNRRSAVALADVVAVRRSHFDAGRTALATLGIAAGGALVILLAGASQSGQYYPIY